MGQFKWSNDLSVGVQNMDRDHQNIIRLMDQLESSFGSDFNTILGKFDELIAFTLSHFEREEAYMANIKFPSIDSHKLIHKDLVNKLNGYYDRFKLSKEPDPKLLLFLQTWLRAHICGIDKKYGSASQAA